MIAFINLSALYACFYDAKKITKHNSISKSLFQNSVLNILQAFHFRSYDNVKNTDYGIKPLSVTVYSELSLHIQQL